MVGALKLSVFSQLLASSLIAAVETTPKIHRENHITHQQSTSQNVTYDYIVVGSGPGGGPLAANLARAGFSTVLIEAGDDESVDPATNVAGYFASTGIHDNLHWDFYVKHYDDDEKNKRYNHLVWKLPNGNLWVGPGSEVPDGAVALGVNYPRGATLGGSSIINAAGTFLPQDSDWDYISNLTGDVTWSSDHMRALFEKLENNIYLPNGTAGHGFSGYLEVNIGDGNQYLSSSKSVAVLDAMIREKGEDPANIKEILTADANYLNPDRDTTAGIWALPFHVNRTWGRTGARDRILDTVRKGYPLTLQLNSYASKVLFDTNPTVCSQPRAVGVEFLEGKSAYKGDPRWAASNTTAAVRRVFANKEVIVSGGSFNTPQLLLLSGIGPAADLTALDIPVVADLPGVGTNMQDNEEVAIIGLAAEDFVSDTPSNVTCTFDTTGANDPCYDLWLQGIGPYTNAGPNSNAFLFKTNFSTDGERDVLMFAGPFEFLGFWPATPNQSWPVAPNTWGMHTVKMHPNNNQGTVKLISADPADMPEINFKYFSDPAGAAVDMGAMKEVIAWGRRAFMGVDKPTGPVNITLPPCPAGPNADGTCSTAGADEEWIRDQTFGHHVTSTCAIGADGDAMAVLDSKFKVRGVDGLRVVDASVFPKIPGAFPVIATFMVSEKAAETILGGE